MNLLLICTMLLQPQDVPKKTESPRSIRINAREAAKTARTRRRQSSHIKVYQEVQSLYSSIHHWTEQGDTGFKRSWPAEHFSPDEEQKIKNALVEDGYSVEFVDEIDGHKIVVSWDHIDLNEPEPVQVQSPPPNRIPEVKLEPQPTLATPRIAPDAPEEFTPVPQRKE